MATIRLVPSTYAVSSASYLSVSNAQNMYANTDSTTYATITNNNASTSSRYLYLRGFNFSDIPAGATINSFTIKVKGYERSLATGTSYAPRLANGTSALSGTTASENFGTSAKTITIPTGALTWQQIVNYGANFTILIYVRRNSRNTTGYAYIYGAEIEVDYTLPSEEPPVITIGTPDKTRISDESGHDECICTFTADQTLVQWEARAVKNGVMPQRGVGVLVETGTNLAAGAQGRISVVDEELTSGDGVYLIAVYGRNAGGVWNE